MPVSDVMASLGPGAFELDREVSMDSSPFCSAFLNESYMKSACQKDATLPNLPGKVTENLIIGELEVILKVLNNREG